MYANRFKEKFGDQFKLVSKYVDNKTEIAIKCKNCEREFSKIAGNVREEGKQKLTCNCSYEKTGPKDRTDAEWQKIIDEMKGEGEYKIVKKLDYNNRIVQHKCGIRFEVDFRRWARSDRSCKNCECSLLKPVTMTKQIHDKNILEIRGEDYVCVKFRALPNKCTYKHLECGKIFEKTWKKFILAQSCPHCHGNMGQALRSISLKEIKRRIKSVKNGECKFVSLKKGNSLFESEGVVVVRCNLCKENYDVSFRQLTTKEAGHCPNCYPKSGASIKIIEIAGKEYRCMGHEPEILKLLVNKYPNSKIITSGDANVKRIKYKYEGKRRNYFPDFYLPEENLIVEVKSLATLGLIKKTYAFFGENLFEKMQAKAQQCIRSRYRFKIYLFNNSRKLLQLPKNWITMDKYDVAEEMGIDIS